MTLTHPQVQEEEENVPPFTSEELEAQQLPENSWLVRPLARLGLLLGSQSPSAVQASGGLLASNHVGQTCWQVVPL